MADWLTGFSCSSTPVTPLTLPTPPTLPHPLPPPLTRQVLHPPVQRRAQLQLQRLQGSAALEVRQAPGSDPAAATAAEGGEGGAVR